MNQSAMPRVPVHQKKDPKDSSQDPNAKHYAVVLRAGLGDQSFVFSMDNDVSAGIAALFLALQYFPKVDRLEVYRKGGPDPNVTSDIGAGICHVPMAELLKFAAPKMEKLTGFVPPATAELVKPIDRDTMGKAELETRAKDKKTPQTAVQDRKRPGGGGQ